MVPFFFDTSIQFGPSDSDGSRHTQLVVICYSDERGLDFYLILVSLEVGNGSSPAPFGLVYRPDGDFEIVIHGQFLMTIQHLFYMLH